MKIMFLFLVLFSIPSYANVSMKSFSLSSYSIVVDRRIKGVASHQIKGKDIAHVGGAGYFEPGSYKLIDLVIIKGKTLKSYRWDWARPILCVKGRKVWIQRPKRGERFLEAVDYAIACDYKTTHPKSVVGRQIVALKNNSIYFLKFYSTENWARKTLKKYGLNDFVFLDGGSSTPSNAPIPVHLVVKCP